MKCNHCNAEVAEGTKFCPNCGNPVVYQQQLQQPNQQEQSQQSQTGVILKLIEYLFYILAAADFLLGTFGIVDITGFKYSPIVFAVIGAIIGQYVKKKYGIIDDDE